jgi:inner membrane protein
MPTVVTHGAVAIGLGRALGLASRRPLLLWALSAGASAMPDLDVVAWPLGIPYGTRWAHRGISHSLAFAVMAGIILSVCFHRRLGLRPGRLAAYFALVTASHGVLDALTNGGPGVAFFAPFDDTRYFFPWRPVLVSPIGLRFFSRWGLEVMQSELVWIWLPLGLALAAIELARRARRGRVTA